MLYIFIAWDYIFLINYFKVLFYLFYYMLLIMRKSIKNRKIRIEIYKLKWVFIYILLLIMLSSFSILIDLKSYFYAATIMFIMLLIYVLSETQLNRKFVSCFQSIYGFFYIFLYIVYMLIILQSINIISLRELHWNNRNYKPIIC